jgi:hypothetical protein
MTDKRDSAHSSGNGNNTTNTVTNIAIKVMVTAVYFFFVIVLSVWFSNLGYTGIGEVIGFVSLISEVIKV